MPILLSNPQLELLRGPHKTRVYLTIAHPHTAHSSQVDGVFDVGDTVIDFDTGVLTGSFTFGQIVAMTGCEVWVGTVAGSDNLGRVRLRGVSSADAGVTGTFTFSANNIAWVAGAHITVKLDFRVRPRFPKIDAGTETFYKEWGALAYADQNEEPPPVVLAGTHQVFFSDEPGPFYGDINLDLSDSYATAQGATVDEYEAYGISQTGLAFTGFGPGPVAADTVVVVEYGQAWIRCRVQDDNGKEQVSWRFTACSPTDPTSPYYPITEFDNLSLSGSWEEGGWKASLTLRNVNDTQFDDGALCVLWAETDYDGDDECVTLLPGTITVGVTPQNNKVILAGYIRRQVIDQNRANGVGGVPVEITTIEGVLRQHYQFSMSLEVVPGAPDTWWKYMSWLTSGRAIHHFWKWHTNLFDLADVVGLTDNGLLRAYAEIEDGTFYTMADDFLRNRAIRCHVTCDKGGRIHIAPEIQLLQDAERNALDTVFALLPDDTSGVISFTHSPENNISFVEVSGFSYGGAFDADGAPIVTPHCAIAPGQPPDDDGPSATTFEYQTLGNQAHANALAGRYYAWQNNEWPEIRVTHPGDYLRVLEPCIPVWYTMSVAADDTLFDEKLEWTDKRLILRQVSLSYDGNKGFFAPQSVFEAEATGPDGVPIACPTVPEEGGGGEPEEPPEEDAGPAIITGSSAYFLPLTEQTWDLRTNEDVLNLAADPWWRIKQLSSSPSDAIIIRCGEGYIKRSYDAGVTWEDITPVNDPTNCMSDTPAPQVSELLFDRHDSCYVNEGVHVFLANAVSPLGDPRCWVAYTDDDCATYSWVCLNTPGGTPGQGGVESTGGQMFRGSVNGTYLASGQTLRVMQKISDTQFFFMFVYGLGLGAVIGTKEADNSITLGTIYELDTSLTVPSLFYGTCCMVDTNVVGMVYGDFDLYGCAATISGTVISFSSQTLVGSASLDIVGAIGTSIWSNPNICSVDGGTTMLAAAVGVTSGAALSAHTGIYAKVITWDGTGVLAQGGWAIGDNAYKFESVDITSVDESHAILVTGEISGNPLASGNRTVRGIVAEVNVMATVMGTGAQIHNSNANGGGGSVAMYGNTGIVVHQGSSSPVTNIRTISVSPATLTFSVSAVSALSPGGSFTQPSAYCVHRIAPGRYLITSCISTNAARIWETDGIVEQWAVEAAAVAHSLDLSSAPLAIGDFVLSFGPAQLTAYSTGGSGTISQVEGRDIRLGRGTGDKIYVTTKEADTNKNILFVLDTSPAITDQFDITLTATENFYVETDWDDDDHIWLYGRMFNDALSLVHIAESMNGGSTLSSYEDGWGGSYAGALRLMNGIVYAVRNVSGEAWLYTNGTYRSTIPFPAGVRPRGMVISTRGTVFVAANDGQGVMVMMSRSPYTTWTDITYNHGTTDGVWSIDLL